MIPFVGLWAAFTDSRKPHQAPLVIGQANVANQQVVHNVRDAKKKTANEVGLEPAKELECHDRTD